MKTSKNSAEQDIWKYAHAVRSFKMATEVIEEIRKASNNQNFVLVEHLWTSFFINYARPFSNNNGIGMISCSVVPPELKSEHCIAIKVRNKSFGHEDPDVAFNDGEPINKVIIQSSEDKFVIRTTKIIPKQHRTDSYGKLVTLVLNNTSEKLLELIDENMNFQDLPLGEYFLDYHETNGISLKNVK